MTTAPFMLTASGREYQLAGPCAILNNPPNLQDIAHHLSQINRYTGACFRPYSVAEHSLLVERIGVARGASPGLRMALLMHDAHEAYTTDMSSPAKEAIGIAWRSFESVHATNVRHYFGLRTAFAAWSKEITRCDQIALATERRDLMPYDPVENEPWPVLDTRGAEVLPAQERLNPDDAPTDWRGMRADFISKYLQLRELVQRYGIQGVPA